jgi:integrase
MTAQRRHASPSERALTAAVDYLGLDPEDRYRVISQQFPAWLLHEPVVFPRHDPTYGWSCRVNGCTSLICNSATVLLCNQHIKNYSAMKAVVTIEDFIRDAKPAGLHKLGWALTRRKLCTICGDNREADYLGYCGAHHQSFRKAQARNVPISEWRRSQRTHPRLPGCSVMRCVRDGSVTANPDKATQMRLCRSHLLHWKSYRARSSERGSLCWQQWLASPSLEETVTPETSRGEVRLAHLPPRLQREVRYAIHRHAKTPRRTQWRPTAIQKVLDALAKAKVQSLGDPGVSDLARAAASNDAEWRVWIALPFAARSLSVTAEDAKTEGWFDPVIVGGAPFSGTQGQENRRKAWSLTAISQRWLRDALWEHLREEAIKPAGKREAGTAVYARIKGIALLSLMLRQNRRDHGDDADLLGQADAAAVKDTWDLWYREKIEVSTGSGHLIVLNERSRHVYMSSIRTVLHGHRDRQTIPAGLNLFILSLPQYPRPPKSARPRPLSFGDFQQLVAEDNLRGLHAADADNLGLADIWLTQAFQGGRISETMTLRLGCVGLIGAAQPYIWRDITKVNVVDFGMPCHLPVYERLLRRQAITRARLRTRYAEELDTLDHAGRRVLEATWDRTMPLFPGAVKNPDFTIPVSYSWFRSEWTKWFERLGLSGITTHQTRATLATSLLNNGAPPALVSQLLGHFSHESLAHYARYNNDTMMAHLQRVWAAGPGTDKPGTILLRPHDVTTIDTDAAAARIDLAVVPVEHGLCRYGPVVGGQGCPFDKNCTSGPKGPCEHFVLTGADLAYWERKRDAAFHFAEGAPSEEARDYILGEWHPWEPVLAGLRQALDELGLLEQAEKLDLRAPVHDYFNPIFSTGWTLSQLDAACPST